MPSAGVVALPNSIPASDAPTVRTIRSPFGEGELPRTSQPQADASPIFSAGHLGASGLQYPETHTDVASLFNAVRGPRWMPSAGSFLCQQYEDSRRAFVEQRRGNANSTYSTVVNFRPDHSLAALSPSEIHAIESVQTALLQAQINPKELPRGAKADYLAENCGISLSLIEEALVAISRHSALSKLKPQVDPVLRVLTEEGRTDLFSHEAHSGRCVLPLGGVGHCLPLSARSLSTNGLEQLAISSPGQTTSSQAEQIVSYLAGITRRHSHDVQLADEFLAKMTGQIARQIESGNPLRFSLYLTLDSFPHALDTRQSVPHTGELQFVRELAYLSDQVFKATGVRPQFTIIDEALAVPQFSNSGRTGYLSRYTDMVRAYGLEESLTIVPLNYGFFEQFLTGRGVTEPEAKPLVQGVHQLLQEAYRQVIHGKITAQTSGDQIFDLLAGTHAAKSCGVSEEIQREVSLFVAKNWDPIHRECAQGVKTERLACIDSSILYPCMSERVLRHALNGTGELTRDELAASTALSSNLREQAKVQSITFKSLMRMRYFFTGHFGGSLLPSDVVPLSITSAPNKFSIGRNQSDALPIEGDDLRGVGSHPQHGFGVVYNGAVTTVPWSEIVDRPDQFHFVTVQGDGIEVEAAVLTMRAVLSDLDRTLKDQGQAVSDDVFALMYDCQVRGIPFGIATGRSIESTYRLVIDPYLDYLSRTGLPRLMEAEHLLYFAANNGAKLWTGLSDQTPRRSTELDLAQLLTLPLASNWSQFLRAYCGSESPSVGASEVAPHHDKHCLYLAGERLEDAKKTSGMGFLNMYEMTAAFNREFVAHGVQATAQYNGNSIDIVPRGVDKGAALADFEAYVATLRDRPVRRERILCLGDQPEGNDGPMLSHRGGNSYITDFGAAAVAQFARAMLNVQPMRGIS